MNDIELYAVQNSEGKWFRRKGYGGYGDTWTDKFKLARVYNSIQPARACISFFANHYPIDPAPKLVRLVVSDVIVLDETERVEKQKRNKMLAEAKRDKRQKEWELESMKKRVEQSRNRVLELEKDLSQ